MSLIIIEGCDQTGKTTLAETFCTSSHDEVIHAGPPTADPLIEYQLSLSDYQPSVDTTVLDRWHWGERVWPRVFDRKTTYGPPQHLHTELFLQSRGAVVLLAERPLSALVEACAQADEPIQGAVQIQDVIDRFRRVFYESILPKRFYDFEVDTYESYTELAGEWSIRVYEMFNVTTEWLGHPRPDAMLVGERPSPGDPRQHVPFLPRSATAGDYLMRALIEADLKRVAIVNAFKFNGEQERLMDCYETLGCPQVVALGRVAKEECRRQGLAPTTVSHPQWWRRFQHHDLEGYASALLDAALV